MSRLPRRHRARRDAADVGVMRARGGEEFDVRCIAASNTGRDDRQVGQVRAARVRRVHEVRIAGPQVGAVGVEHGRNARSHRAEVHRHVRRVGDQVRVGVEQRAGEIEPLLDVDRARGLAQHGAHLLGDVHEQAR